MIDCEGKEIRIGQQVIFTKSKWAEVRIGTVTKIHNLMIEIEFSYGGSDYMHIYNKTAKYVYAI